MRQTALVGIAVVTVAIVAACMGSASGKSNEDAAPIYGIKIPDGYRDWHLISVKHLTGAGGELKQLRAQLGNDIAIKAFRDGTRPFPDGAIIAALHWNEDSSDADNNALASGFLSLGLKSSFAGKAVNVQFMVKDSKKVRRVRWLGICRLHERQTWDSGAARKVLHLPLACKRQRLCFHPLCTYALNRTGDRNHRKAATTAQMASTSPNGHAPCRKP
jgi:hypothetical protein